MTENSIAHAIATNGAHRWHYRKMMVVRNVSWGLNFLYELDVLAVSKTGCAHEIEIKTTRSDLLRDSKKGHNHDSKRTKYLWFAGPMEMRDSFTEILEPGTGIILVNEAATNTRNGLEIVRNAKPRPGTRAFTADEICDLGRLGTMRYWCRKG